MSPKFKVILFSVHWIYKLTVRGENSVLYIYTLRKLNCCFSKLFGYYYLSYANSKNVVLVTHFVGS